MRINQFVARATGMSRRAADAAVQEGRVSVNGQKAGPGLDIKPGDSVSLGGKALSFPQETTTIMLNKPAGYVCSRDGQGSQTIYDLLPPEFHALKPVGRLDKDSAGLILLTNDGELANRLTHPSYGKQKVYEIELDRTLAPTDKEKIEGGVKLDDGDSKLQIKNLNGKSFTVTMSEGRNRQIRRTFAALGYQVTKLHRTQFGGYALDNLTGGDYVLAPAETIK